MPEHRHSWGLERLMVVTAKGGRKGNSPAKISSVFLERWKFCKNCHILYRSLEPCNDKRDRKERKGPGKAANEIRMRTEGECRYH